jgi:hypothetical protein
MITKILTLDTTVTVVDAFNFAEDFGGIDNEQTRSLNK